MSFRPGHMLRACLFSSIIKLVRTESILVYPQSDNGIDILDCRGAAQRAYQEGGKSKRQTGGGSGAHRQFFK